MRSLAKAIYLSVLFKLLAAASISAGWIENGIPLTPYIGNSEDAAIVTDGSSGAIIAYKACIADTSHIIVQRVDSLGARLWGEGVIFCSEATRVFLPKIVSDGAGGAIIVWYDNRSGDSDIYAQRISSAGTVLWQANGVPICTAAQDQYYPQMTSDGEGGATIAWQDYRSGTHSDIYAQRVDISGEVLWQANGVPLCTVPHSKWSIKIVSDGAAGAIVAWDDYRNGYWDIYAQRVDPSGSVRWMTDGIPICTATGWQNVYSIVSDGENGAIALWHDNRNGDWDIYMQRMDSLGSVIWTVDGMPLCAESGDQFDPESNSDGSGGAIVTWYDSRSGNYDIYAQRVDPSGSLLWMAGGVPLCTATDDQNYPHIASVDPGGATIAWQDDRSGDSDAIYAQRIDASGTVLWQIDGVPVCEGLGFVSYPVIISDSGEGVIVAWEDSRSSASYIYTQRLDASGTILWDTDGVSLCTPMGTQNRPVLVSDDAGGAVVVWTDRRGGDDDIYGQRLNASGTAQWQSDGLPICTEAGIQSYLEIVSDGAGGAIASWIDHRSGNGDIYAQRVDGAGVLLWQPDGVPLCTSSESPGDCQVTTDSTGGAIVAWLDFSAAIMKVCAQRVDLSGAVLWHADGVPICTAAGIRFMLKIASDGAGGAIITWMDARAGIEDIYAQRVDGSGTVLWQMDGVPICEASESQWDPCITSDGAGGAIIAWSDNRGGSNDIFAQRVDALGLILWPTNGVPICNSTGSQLFSDIASDNEYGAIVTWEDERNGNRDIYAQRVDPSGAVLWGTYGDSICVEAEWQEDPRIAADGAGGAIITWEDYRSGMVDVYAQRVDASGTTLWQADGVPLCTAGGSQKYPQLISDGDGGAIVAWEDHRCGSQIYAARVSGSGDLVATLLQTYSASIESGSIRIRWTLSEMDEGASFTVLRATAPDWIYYEIDDARIERDGLSFSFTDDSCLPGTTKKYRIDVETEGVPTRTLFETDEITVPAIPLTLYQNHPNPFNPNTVIRFYLPEACEITLDIYNVAGQRVVRLAEGKWQSGHREVEWDGRNGSGAACSSGIYFYRLRAGKDSISRKMVLLR